MPVTHNIQILIDNQLCDLGDMSQDGFHYTYALENPENFQEKQGSYVLGVDLPTTPTNDAIFNTFYDPNVMDMSGSNVLTNYRSCSVRIDGIELVRGTAILIKATRTRVPGKYSIDILAQNGDWVILAQDLTLWDCLNTESHTFDVATVEDSWTSFDSDEFHDFVYAPVRYRQPFDGTALVDSSGNSLNLSVDNALDIYHLRPSISIYWLLVRGFRQLGYSINSVFLNNPGYFRRLVMPWTWGDFYDLNDQLEQGLCFTAAGEITTAPPPPSGSVGSSGVIPFWTGVTCWEGSLIGSAGGSSWWGFALDGFTASAFNSADGPCSFSNGVPGKGIVGCTANGINETGGVYVVSGDGTSPGGNDHFVMDINYPPYGSDTFLQYSFDNTTGTMIYRFNPPPLLASLMANVSATFTFSLYFNINGTDNAAVLGLELTQLPASGGPTSITCLSLVDNGGSLNGTNSYPAGMDERYCLTPTVVNFTVQGISPGEQLNFRLRCLADTAGLGGAGGYKFGVFSGGYLNSNASVLGIPSYHFNPVTERYDFSQTNSIWFPVNSTLKMNDFLLQLGGSVNFQDYDNFRSYRFLDLLGGVIDSYNLTVQTNSIERIVTIEPMTDYVLQVGGLLNSFQGYFWDKQLDWTHKRDINKEEDIENYRDPDRQFDFQLQQDGSDGGQNIFAARYKGIYLNNVKATMFNVNSVNSTNNQNGMIAAIPGASRYMFPPRFPRGSVQHNNHFFSATMHYQHTPWATITSILSGGTDKPVSPQLICIFPENINGSSADAITATFTPKIAFYSGQQNINAVGGWRWVGDPNAGGNNVPSYNDAGTGAVSGVSAIGFQLPYMFAVDYTGTVGTAPGDFTAVLTMCDQNINGSIVPGLMKTFFLKRLAIMRNGQLCKRWMQLKLEDIIDWEHRYTIIIDGSLYYLIGIDNFNALSDESCQCTFWKVDNPNADDLANIYPSATSVLTSPSILAQFDLKYAQLLIFYNDMPITD